MMFCSHRVDTLQLRVDWKACIALATDRLESNALPLCYYTRHTKKLKCSCLGGANRRELSSSAYSVGSGVAFNSFYMQFRIKG